MQYNDNYALELHLATMFSDNFIHRPRRIATFIDHKENNF
jgi:hypothetical protein